MSSLTKIPAGVQYFFDDEVRLRRYVERQAMEVFAGWSYDEIILPMFDYHDLFARGMGAEQAEKTYRFVDRDGALLALRPELTSLVARTVATRFIHRGRPIRLCSGVLASIPWLRMICGTRFPSSCWAIQPRH